jgi:septum formation protein
MPAGVPPAAVPPARGQGTGPRLVLASRSPQRRAILAQLGVPFEVRPAEVVEQQAGDPAEVARENARRKALAVDRGPGEVVLGVDTLVAGDPGEIWGKPPTEEAARDTLRRLAGRTHRVVSGLALARASGDVRVAVAVTEVTFRPFGEETLAWYLAAREWEERAGGYAIQGRGAALVERIAGDYLNVVGLPVAALLDLWPEILDLAQ